MTPQDDQSITLLLVTDLFAPAQAIGARRCENLVRHLVAGGWDVTVLTPRPEFMRSTLDPSIPIPKGITLLRTGTWSPRRWAAGMKQIFTGRKTDQNPTHRPQSADREQSKGIISKLLSSTLEFPDAVIGWKPLAKRAVRGRSFDVVLTSIPSWSNAIIAASIARQCGSKFVLDYRDPWSDLIARLEDTWKSHNLSRYRTAEMKCIRAADLVVGVTPTICEWLSAHNPSRLEYVSNGFSPRPGPPKPTRSGRLEIMYAGQLGYGRSLTPVLRAIAIASERHALDIRLTYAGGHGVSFQHQVQETGSADFVRDLGRVNLDEALELMTTSDAGIVVVSREFDYAFPGKIFEIVASETPILQIAPVGSAASDLVSTYGLGWTHPESDVEGIVASLLELEKRDFKFGPRVKELELSVVMDKYERLLREVLHG